MVSTAEKIHELDRLIKKYHEKKFLREIRKSYEPKSDEDVIPSDMNWRDIMDRFNREKVKEGLASMEFENAMLDRLKPGECMDVEMHNGDDELMFKARVCKTKAD